MSYVQDQSKKERIKQFAIKAAEKTKGPIECPACGKGRFRGIFYFSCTNLECLLHNSWAEHRCTRCGAKRVDCCC